MEPVIFLEVVDRRGRVRERVPVEAAATLRIGRAYDNDVILDDPYVSEYHLRLDADGEGAVVAHDLGSLNGLTVDGHGRVESARLGPGDAVRVGESLLRMRRSDDPVAPARLLAAGPWPLGWLERPWVAALAVLLIPLDAAVTQLYASSTRWEPGDALGAVLETASLLVGWAVAWALVTRVARHQWHLLTHLAIALLATAALQVVGIAHDYASFLTGSLALWGLLRLVAVVVIAWGLRLHLALATALEPVQRRAAAAGAAVLVVGGLALLDHLAARTYTTEIRFASTLRPVPVAWLPAAPAAAFLAETERIRARVDAMRAEKDGEGTGGGGAAAAAGGQPASAVVSSSRRSFQ